MATDDKWSDRGRVISGDDPELRAARAEIAARSGRSQVPAAPSAPVSAVPARRATADRQTAVPGALYAGSPDQTLVTGDSPFAPSSSHSAHPTTPVGAHGPSPDKTIVVDRSMFGAPEPPTGRQAPRFHARHRSWRRTRVRRGLLRRPPHLHQVARHGGSSSIPTTGESCTLRSLCF